MTHRWFSPVTTRALHWGAWAVVALFAASAFDPPPAHADAVAAVPAAHATAH